VKRILNVFSASYRSVKSICLLPVPITRAGAYIVLSFIGCGIVLLQTVGSNLPGLAIGLLAAATVVMTVRGERIKTWEKVGWIIVAFVLFMVETRTIYRDREEQNRQFSEERAHETERFNRIVDGLKGTIAISDKHFNSTMLKMKDLLYEQTGGDTHLFFDIDNDESLPMEITARKGAWAFPRVVGDYPLNDVSVMPVCPDGHIWPELHFDHLYPSRMGEMGRLTQGIRLQLPDPPPKQFVCSFFIFLASGTYVEQIHFVQVEDGKWAWKAILDRKGRFLQSFTGYRYPKDTQFPKRLLVAVPTPQPTAPNRKVEPKR
jgi:hypothetical protein